MDEIEKTIFDEVIEETHLKITYLDNAIQTLVGIYAYSLMHEIKSSVELKKAVQTCINEFCTALFETESI